MSVLTRPLLPTLALLALLAACASPQSRIERSPEAFQALDAEQQALVQQGKIAIGFSEQAVRLALGEPHRVTQRTDEKGATTVWRYVEREGGVYSDFYYPGFAAFGAYGRPIGINGVGLFGGGFYGPGVTTLYTANGPHSERDRLRVLFVDGKVSAIEEEVK